MAKKTEHARMESIFAKLDNELKKKREAQILKKKSAKASRDTKAENI